MTSKAAYFVVKKEYYDEIALGKKTSEFRIASPYWIERLDTSIKEAVFQLGYGRNGAPPPRMRYSVIGIFIHDTLQKSVIPYPKSVSDIPNGFRSCLIEVKLGRRLE